MIMPSTVRRKIICALTFPALLALPVAAYPHAFGARYDLPLPLNFYLSAAGIAVALSFIITFFIVKSGESNHALTFNAPIAIAILKGSLRISGVIILILILLTAFFGDTSPTRNLATITVWVLWWVGMTLFSALVIDLWPALNPTYTLARWVNRLLPTKTNYPPLPSFTPYLATTGFLFLAWIELVSDISETPLHLFYLIIIYLLFSCLLSRRYGIDSWFNNADPLTRMFNLLGRSAPFSLTTNHKLIIRLPGTGLLLPKNPSPQAATTLFIMALISVVLFDGIAETPIWQAILNHITQSQEWRPLLLSIKDANIDILGLLKTGGLIAMLFISIMTYWLLTYCIWLMVNRQIALQTIAYHFAFSLIPIAIAYHLSHYISYLLLAGQLILPIISDPLGMGWDLFGTKLHRIDLSVINAEDVWWVAIIAIVVGHMISALIAHRTAVRLFTQRKQAIQSQIPMMVFMTLLTCFSLWILAQPIVNT